MNNSNYLENGRDLIVEMVDPTTDEVVAVDFGFQVITDNDGDAAVSEAVDALRSGAGDQVVGLFVLRRAR